MPLTVRTFKAFINEPPRPIADAQQGAKGDCLQEINAMLKKGLN